MLELIKAPLRTYLVFGLFTLAGLVAAFQLPISLFPDSQQPQMRACVPTNMSPEAFMQSHGSRIEERLRSIGSDSLRVEKVSAFYEIGESCFLVQFRWGDSPEKALFETRSAFTSMASSLPTEFRERARVYPNNQNSGFLAVVFSSARRTPDEIYRLLRPLLAPKISMIRDAEDPSLWNPKQKQLIVELRPEAMASFGLFPSSVAAAVDRGLESYGAGSLVVGLDSLAIQFPRPSQGLEGLKRMPVAPVQGRTVTLGDVAHLDFAVPLDGARSFKANGTPSVLLFSSPRPGGNVASMANQALAASREAMLSMPADVSMKPLVDPSDFIRAATTNVAHEAGLAALIAVITIWLFVGNARNVATAALEIPLSMVLAFILMRFTNVGINLISLAGLALSAGMNVDASVVVMENVFRRMREARNKERFLSRPRKAEIVAEAVSEVRFPVIASAAASIVVFVPLAFTSELTYALLGDLAKAVAFSHGCSVFVALILVPTIRFHLMKDDPKVAEGAEGHQDPHGPLEPLLLRLENFYVETLERFLARPRQQAALSLVLLSAFALLVVFVAPRLPREIVGKPSADWLTVEVNTRGNTENRQMETLVDATERKLIKHLGAEIVSTFSQVDTPNYGWAMIRIRDKSRMDFVQREAEELLADSPLLSHKIYTWNPAELSLPDPPDVRVAIRGASPEELAATAREVGRRLNELKIFSRVNTLPENTRSEGIFVKPKLDLLPQLAASGAVASTAELADLTRAATGPRYVTRFEHEGQDVEAYMRFPEGFIEDLEDLAALPIGIGGKIVPLKAIATVDRGPAAPAILRENGQEVAYVEARLATQDKGRVERARSIAQDSMVDLQKQISLSAQSHGAAAPSITLERPDTELQEALLQLMIAAAASALLIFVTMTFQFGNATNALMVLMAAPLGLIGAIASLYIFGSTLSLNSMLGVILLNGLAVANGVMLIDFMNRAVASGLDPVQAALETGRQRLRPILMTATTTALGMLPIALGAGEGGKVLQPLGISVAGGLAFSTAATLFVVPTLNVIYWRSRRSGVT